MGLEWRMVLGGWSLGLSALSPCRLGSRLLGKRVSWLVQSAGTLALIPAHQSRGSKAKVQFPACFWERWRPAGVLRHISSGELRRRDASAPRTKHVGLRTQIAGFVRSLSIFHSSSFRQKTTWSRWSALDLLEMTTGFGRWPTYYGSPKKTGRFSDATA